MPIFFSLIEQDGVTKMQKRSVIGTEVLVHNSFVNDNLFPLGAVGPVVVELECLHKLVLAVGIPLIGLDDWHAALIGLDDVHR